ncbi:Beta-2-glycoprotein 1 [Bagarius yarrelli]|uniref:Beta-2-glycoprotein 1 n=1 Tax=Bagarius yarrelli TaxID=175774 RepID=A0A556TTH0_BAGYA|nr:Beta-2-glycoprotein 1 [Bagarius yarrelli]
MRMRLTVQGSLLSIWCACLFSTVTTNEVCHQPPEENGSELRDGQLFFEPGTEVTLSCSKGYSSAAKKCPAPESPQNGKAVFNDIVYKSVITYSCEEGYILDGANYSECLHTAQWSEPSPQCKPVICDLPLIPPYAKIVYDGRIREDTVEYGFGGTYECLPPLVLFGEKRATCNADGKWSTPPACKLVSCPVPQEIENGFLSFAELRDHGYQEKVKYGCNQPYVLDGLAEVLCEETGLWSRIPVCKAPCKVNIEKGRIVYKGIKKWIEDFQPNQVLHSEQVTVYCNNEKKKCGYPVSMRCDNGHMPIPDCYKVPPKEHLKPFKSNPVTVSTEHYRHSGSSLLGAGLPSSVGGKGRMKTMKRTRRAQIFGPVKLPTDVFNEQRCWESLQGPNLSLRADKTVPFFSLFVYLLAEERNRESEGGRRIEKKRKDESEGMARSGAPLRDESLAVDQSWSPVLKLEQCLSRYASDTQIGVKVTVQVSLWVGLTNMIPPLRSACRRAFSFHDATETLTHFV